MTAAVTALQGVRRHRRRPDWLVLSSMVVVGLVLVCAVAGRWIAPFDPTQQNLALGLTGPSAEHPLGTDVLGRDMLSRLLAGTASATVGPLVMAVGAMILGSLLGLVAGYRGGRLDSIIMRWVDLMFSLPGTLVVIVVAGAFGGGYWTAVVLLIILTSPGDARIIRQVTLEQVPRPYVEAARSIGASDLRIMLRHIAPNIAPIAVANVSINFAGTLVALAGLSFLGLGVAAGTPDWGLMVSEGRSLLFVNPIAVLAPAVAIVATATSVSVVGDWAYERLSSRGEGR